MTAAQIIAIICPSLDASGAATQYIEMATRQTSAGYYGVNFPRAVALRAAHMFTLDSRLGGSGEAGAVTQKTEGRLSVSFGGAGGGGAIADLDQTSFGKQLKGLRNGSGIAASVAGLGPQEGC